MNGRPCKCGCGLPTIDRRWYACHCPNARARADAQYQKLLAAQQRRRIRLGGQPRRTARLKDETAPVKRDISQARIDLIVTMAKPWLRYHQREREA